MEVYAIVLYFHICPIMPPLTSHMHVILLAYKAIVFLFVFRYVYICICFSTIACFMSFLPFSLATFSQVVDYMMRHCWWVNNYINHSEAVVNCSVANTFNWPQLPNYSLYVRVSDRSAVACNIYVIIQSYGALTVLVLHL